MTTEQFAYWLQGFAEVHGGTPTPEQWDMIKEHLQTCFVKVTSEKKIGKPTVSPGGIGTGAIPEWLKQTNQPGYGTGFPPGTITC